MRINSESNHFKDGIINFHLSKKVKIFLSNIFLIVGFFEGGELPHFLLFKYFIFFLYFDDDDCC